MYKDVSRKMFRKIGQVLFLVTCCSTCFIVYGEHAKRHMLSNMLRNMLRVVEQHATQCMADFMLDAGCSINVLPNQHNALN